MTDSKPAPSPDARIRRHGGLLLRAVREANADPVLLCQLEAIVQSLVIKHRRAGLIVLTGSRGE